mmetsp:Transcript_1667/g.3511  ORF Transcript_1667/g.3511 Transcript_1667/m.3511 type:complete len:178 (-) Transcript_1667:250-783(-)|eukprot:CAMPEP_0172588450 /NCGR_PEP_ID=MMETSP1068-20121228/7348_1 /TAXON_ID=35684 /ORGANISM="Pseudopedinella elastica, Strain CCMP716" /LENGTH=177 /DNA_ID=CAMNT_0013383773 /DNA_START=108 /DNA_END=641 /DNA_ORIENTATION=+
MSLAGIVFSSAVGDGDLLEVYTKLLNGADANNAYVGVTPLRVAIENKDVEMCALLIHFQADPMRNISVPKSTGYRMMTALDFSKHLTSNEKEKEAKKAHQRVLEVLMDEKKEGARKVATDEVQKKLDVLTEARRVKLRAQEKLFCQGLLVVSVLAAAAYAAYSQLGQPAGGEVNPEL